MLLIATVLFLVRDVDVQPPQTRGFPWELWRL
jgi:hypothetical protein